MQAATVRKLVPLTVCGVEGSGSNPRDSKRYSSSLHSPRLASEPTQPPVQSVPGLFSGGTADRAWRCCILCGPDEERILDVVPREDGARNSG